MKLKASNSTKNFHLRKISFNGILNSEYFFHRSGPIKLALNQDRVLRKNFFVKRARPKLDMGKFSKRREAKENNELSTSHDYRRDKTKAPGDLNKVILKYEKKFYTQNKKYYDLRNENDIFLSYWHYINDLSEKKERELMLQKYFNDKDKNTINYHTKEIKKMSENMFKTSPLLTGKRHLDVFFFYLNEIGKHYEDKNKLDYIKQKLVKFLEKLKDLLDFVEVTQDTGLDSITKDIRIKNSKYNKLYMEKVKNEKMKNAIKQKKEDEKSIKQSKKMIEDTYKTLNALEKNKKLFSDDNSPLYINSKIQKSRNSVVQNITPYSTQNKFHIFSGNKTSKMNITSSTAFYLSGKGFFNKNSNKKVFSGLKDNYQEKKEDDNLNSEIEKNKLKFSHIKPQKLTKDRNSMSLHRSIRKNTLVKETKNRLNIKNLTCRNNSLITKINLDKIKHLTLSNLPNISENIKNDKQFQYSNIRGLSSRRIMENMQESNMIPKKVTFIQKNKTSDEIFKDLSKQSHDSINSLMNMKTGLNKNKSQLDLLYDDTKNAKKIKDKSNEEIKNYFIKKGKINESMNSLKNVYGLDIINQAKLITDKMDIEQKTKKVFQAHLTYEQIKHLESIRDINKKLKAMDIQFVNQIIKYKSNKNQ